MKRCSRVLTFACLLSGLVSGLGCSDGLLTSDFGDDTQTDPLGPAMVRDGAADFLDHPDGAEGLPQFGVDISLWSGEITDEEVGCWYDEGVRHVIAGTQNPRVTKQQLDEALEGGMSVDAYIYLHWDEDVTEEVKHDVEMLKDYPIGRLWIDVEEHPAGRSVAQLEAKIQEALDACGETPCGIYTAAWWWEPHMRDSDAFADVPVWYAYYDHDASMQTWARQSFGGWELPWGKQWNEIYFCGIDVDKNTIFTSSDPVSDPKSFESDGEVAVPTGLYPDDMVRIRREDVRALVDVEPDADQYVFEVEHYRADTWRAYYTFTASEPSVHFSPVIRDRVFRFRAKAIGNGGESDWSRWAHFEVGNASEFPEVSDTPPESEETTEPAEEPADEMTEPEPEPQPEPEPEPEPQPEPVPGAPTNLSPQFGANVAGGRLELSCDPVSDATAYEWEIENWYSVTSTWVTYFTYPSSDSSRVFYPPSDLAYRWRVRAQTPGGWTPFSSWQSFTTGDATLPTQL